LFQRFLVSAVLCSCAAISATAGTLYAIDNTDNSLITIDPATLAITIVGNTGAGGSFGDLTYDSTNGNLYWVPGRGNDNLYTINQNTGVATLVGAHGIDDLFALTYYQPADALYGESSTGDVYTLNLSDGTPTLIGNNGIYPGGLTYNSKTGQLILTAAGIADFYSLDPATGAATLLGESGFLDDGGVTYDADRNIYWVDEYGSGSVSQYDTATYTPTQVLSGAGALDGIAYVASPVSATPEPGTIMLLLGGVMIFCFRPRKTGKS